MAEIITISEPGPHDVLCGRGAKCNTHPGNVLFRSVVKVHKLRYIMASKADKPKVAKEVVRIWRNLTPPGRFLKVTSNGEGSLGNSWYDIGDSKAREKASQCLRERTPDVKPFVNSIKGLNMVGSTTKEKREPKENTGMKDSVVASSVATPQNTSATSSSCVGEGAPDPSMFSLNVQNQNVASVLQQVPWKPDFPTQQSMGIENTFPHLSTSDKCPQPLNALPQNKGNVTQEPLTNITGSTPLSSISDIQKDLIALNNSVRSTVSTQGPLGNGAEGPAPFPNPYFNYMYGLSSARGA